MPQKLVPPGNAGAPALPGLSPLAAAGPWATGRENSPQYMGFVLLLPKAG